LSFKKKLVKKYINIKGQVKLVIESILVVNWVSYHGSFSLSASTPTTYIFATPTCTY
jgi:hypothetical protein